jgi:hypothetical protein
VTARLAVGQCVASGSAPQRQVSGSLDIAEGSRCLRTRSISVKGIETDPGATHNTIQTNAVSSDQADLYDSDGPPCVNVWRNNIFQTTGGRGSLCSLGTVTVRPTGRSLFRRFFNINEHLFVLPPKGTSLKWSYRIAFTLLSRRHSKTLGWRPLLA